MAAPASPSATGPPTSKHTPRRLLQHPDQARERRNHSELLKEPPRPERCFVQARTAGFIGPPINNVHIRDVYVKKIWRSTTAALARGRRGGVVSYMALKNVVFDGLLREMGLSTGVFVNG